MLVLPCYCSLLYPTNHDHHNISYNDCKTNETELIDRDVSSLDHCLPSSFRPAWLRPATTVHNEMSEYELTVGSVCF